LQESIYHVSEKAAQGRELCDEEVAFIRQLFELPWWAGVEYGTNAARRQQGQSASLEAKPRAEHKSGPHNKPRGDLPVSDPTQVFLAEMLHHYLHGQGALYPLRRPVYLASVKIGRAHV